MNPQPTHKTHQTAERLITAGEHLLDVYSERLELYVLIWHTFISYL